MSTHEEYITRVKSLVSANPSNLALKYLSSNEGWFLGLSKDQQERVMQIVASGYECPDSSVGAYLTSETDLIELNQLLAPIIAEYHQLGELGNFEHVSDWGGIGELPKLDQEVSVRSRVARNVVGWPLPSAMSRKQRVEFEESMQSILKDAGIQGTWHSLTPGSEYLITDEIYAQLVKEHLFFKSMADDKYLKAAGISSDWPYGRAAFVSEVDGMKMGIWVGEEDHLRIWTFGKTRDLAKVLTTLKSWLDVFENAGLAFMKDSRFGNVTTCPTNLGTGMRTSVHVKLPNLVGNKDSIPNALKALGKSFGLSIRGEGGEHTPPGADGTVDISISQRMGITEFSIAESLITGLNKLRLEEQRLGDQ